MSALAEQSVPTTGKGAPRPETKRIALTGSQQRLLEVVYQRYELAMRRADRAAEADVAVVLADHGVDAKHARNASPVVVDGRLVALVIPTEIPDGQ